MSTLKYTEQHEWVRIEGDVATAGITSFAAEQLGDVVYVELPDVGKAVTQGGEAAVVESVKAASDVYAPLSGEIADVNGALVDNPALVNESPEGEGWFMKIKMSDPAEADKLMDKAAYDDFVKGQS